MTKKSRYIHVRLRKRCDVNLGESVGTVMTALTTRRTHLALSRMYHRTIVNCTRIAGRWRWFSAVNFNANIPTVNDATVAKCIRTFHASKSPGPASRLITYIAQRIITVRASAYFNAICPAHVTVYMSRAANRRLTFILMVPPRDWLMRLSCFWKEYFYIAPPFLCCLGWRWKLTFFYRNVLEAQLIVRARKKWSKS